MTTGGTVGKILCCLCGTSIDPNSAAMCLECMKANYSIVDDFPEQIELTQCPKCLRWHNKLDQWLSYELESTGLMTLCLRKIITLQKKGVKVIDTAWVWTEPHSRRLKWSIDIERGILDDKVQLRQRVLVEAVVTMKQCPQCRRDATEHNWGACIHIRQAHRGRSALLAHLEQTLINEGFMSSILEANASKDGLDLFFQEKNQADRVVEFLSSHFPTRSKLRRNVVSGNLSHSHTGHVEVTINMELVPLVRDDLVLTSRGSTGATDLMLVTRISSNIHLINPTNLIKVEMTAMKYFAVPLQVLLSSKHLITFIVLDISPLEDSRRRESPDDISDSCLLAEAEVAREIDLGVNDVSYRVMTHLGHLLQAGDTVLGYDLSHTVMREEGLHALSYAHPDVILVKKVNHTNKVNKKDEGKKKKKRVKGYQRGSRPREEDEEVDREDAEDYNELEEEALGADAAPGDEEVDDDVFALRPPLPPTKK